MSTVREKYFFKVRELSGNFEICQGILEFMQKSGKSQGIISNKPMNDKSIKNKGKGNFFMFEYYQNNNDYNTNKKVIIIIKMMVWYGTNGMVWNRNKN